MSIGKAGFRMANGNIRVPTASFMCKDRLPGGHAPNTFGDAAPDLCVEILSPSEEGAEMTHKVNDYFESGAQIVWHVFPEAQQVTIFSSPSEARTLTPEDELTTGNILPGFSCRIGDLFILE